ncbi:CoA-binding protein [Desulfofarcimen acetoxidans]|uniref:CoA-binding protein n=1 Tax=Desulfofarcimen acetoxidans TaxID=58138 RepID=UPI0005A7221E|nr:CoA-binding protein [Desulfofarcimen acetoxidans]
MNDKDRSVDVLPNPSEQEIKFLLQNSKKIAIVGLSNKPERDSYMVAAYLKKQGYKIFPVNPGIKEVLGEKAYPSLSDIPEPVDIVNIFRRSSDVPPIIAEAIRLKEKSVWLQLGIVNEEAAQAARAAGLTVVMDRCIKVDHYRLLCEI